MATSVLKYNPWTNTGAAPTASSGITKTTPTVNAPSQNTVAATSKTAATTSSTPTVNTSAPKVELDAYGNPKSMNLQYNTADPGQYTNVGGKAVFGPVPETSNTTPISEEKEAVTSLTSTPAKAAITDAAVETQKAEEQLRADTEARIAEQQKAQEAVIRSKYDINRQQLTEEQKQEEASQNALSFRLGRKDTVYGQEELADLKQKQNLAMQDLETKENEAIEAMKSAVSDGNYKQYQIAKDAYDTAFQQRITASKEQREEQAAALEKETAGQNATKQAADTYAGALLSTDEAGNVIMPDNETIQKISDQTGIPTANLMSSLQSKSVEMSKAQAALLPDIIKEFQQMKKLGYTTATTPLEYQQEKAMAQKGVVKGSITTGGVGSGVSSGSGGISSINSGIINGQQIVISNDAKNWAKQILDGKASLSNVIGKNNTETSRLRSEVVAAMSAGGNISQASAETTAALHDKVTQIDDLISKTDTVGSGVIGPTWLTRWSPVSTLTGSKAAFVGSVHQLISKETLDSLINLKKSGGTLGALSDQERVMLQNAATKIGSWEVKDKNGYGTGVWAVSESEFKKELQNIKTVAERAIKNAGGDTGVVNTLEQTLSAHPEKIDEFNTLVADNPGMSDDDVIQALGF